MMLGYLKKAAALNLAGVSRPSKLRKRAAPALEVPDYFTAALKKNRRALAAFERLSPSHRREYVEWVTEAKREETRARRLATAIQWLAEGKSRNRK